MTTKQAMQIALQQHQAGKLAEAENIYRQILAQLPNHFDALHLLGAIALQKKQYQEAVELIEKAIAIDPTNGIYLNNLGLALKELGRTDEAIEAYCKAIQLQPNFASAQYNLGIALLEQGRLNGAVDALQTAIQLKPADAAAHNSLGIALRNQGKLKEARAEFQTALKHKSGYAEARFNLGNVLREQGEWEAAIEAYREALRHKPGYADALNNMGLALAGQRKFDAAIEAYRETLKLHPHYARAVNNMGNALRETGRIKEAIGEYRRAIQIEPDFSAAGSNLVYSMYFSPDYDAQAIYEELRAWDRRHAEALQKYIQPHTNDRRPERRLKIGYVSSDFCEHASALFLDPLLRHHNHDQYEIFCYSHVARPDQLTEKFRSYTDQWRDISGLTDEAAAAQIRADGIDILVDLKLHTSDNRLLIFARKPAPVQVSWLAYPGSTGMSTMDYRLTDSILDPQGLDDPYYSEKSVRLGQTFWCFNPLSNEWVGELPAPQNGRVTFGCLNQFPKINDQVLEAWTKILGATENSRLLLLAPQGQARERVLAVLGREGISPERVEFVDRMPRTQYLKLLGKMDVGLDPFPCNGHTTSLDSLWMGVPVVTMVGKTVMGRGGKSILTNAGLTELIANTPEEYVQIAVKLAGDVPRLKELRATLRKRMENSPLMDAKRFARNVETAYRDMWHKWCSGAAGRAENR